MIAPLKRFLDLKTFLVVSFFLLNSIPGTFLFLGAETTGSTGNGGFKYLQNYSPQTYISSPQNWAIAQGKNGIIYVANQGNLLEFDGTSWRLIEVPNRTVRSIARSGSGTIYVGGINEIGFLTPDAKGSLLYESLTPHLDNDKKNFGRVWKTHAAEGVIYFYTANFLFRWNPHTARMKVWQPREKRFNAAFTCNGKYFIHQRKLGLKRLVGDSLEFIRGPEKFAAVKIFFMAPYDNEKLLIGTLLNGLYLYDGNKAEPFQTGADAYLKEKQLYHGIRLFGGDFALCTRRGGLVIIDSRGRLKRIFNKARGLRDDNVKHVFQASSRNWWLALNNGISKIEYASPFSFYDQRSNLTGLVLSVIRHGTGQDLYAGTTGGLYYLTSRGKFRLIPGMSSAACQRLLSYGGYLLAATDNGIFQLETGPLSPAGRSAGNITNNKKIKRLTAVPAYFLSLSQKDKNRVWVGTRQGLISLYLHGSLWVVEHTFENIDEDIKNLTEDKNGSLWLGTRTAGAVKVNFPEAGKITGARISRYGTDHGLPEKEVRIFKMTGRVIFATKTGLYRFDREKQAFFPDPILGSEFAGGSKGVFRLIEDGNKNIWFNSKNRNIQAVPREDGGFVLLKKPFLRLPEGQVNEIYPDPNGRLTWFAGNEGLIRYDSNNQKTYDLAFQTLIREVVVNGMPLIYDAEEAKYKTSKNGYWKDKFPVFPYKDRNLRFEFAAPFFEAESRTEYSYYLEGYENDWCEWKEETWRHYTNLGAGLYTFRLKARNIYETISREDSFKFRVLPPWYRTIWAYFIYAIFFFFSVYFIVKWRSWKLLRGKKQLEQVVKDRTKEIGSKNIQLQEQTVQLQEQSKKLKEMDKTKSQFFANISHEFRTPLTLIMGPLEQELEKPRDEKSGENINLALRSSRRLLKLINQLLDLSKLESGRMQLQAALQDIVPFLKGLVYSFESLSEQKELELTFRPEQENIPLYYDAEKLEKVFVNLVANAIKFTPTGGKITVTAAKRPAEENYPNGYLEIKVRDTGIGIPGEDMAYVFDRFYQAGKSTARQRKGTGIGLALAKELVELHHGEIAVHSREGEGSEFIIHLLLGGAHIKPEDITADPHPTSGVKGGGGETCGIPHLRKSAPPLPPQKTFVDFEGEEIEEEKKETGAEELETEEQEKDVILVVEDNPDVRKFIRGPLTPHYKVMEAADGKEGIEKARKIIPDLIVSDVMMPEVDGYQLCDTLKKDVKTSHVPIILLTAKASDESKLQGLQTGADDYITKPFNTQILLTRIKNLIDLRRGLQEKIQRELVLQPTEIAVSSVDQEFIKELKEAIEKNMSEEDFGVDKLAKALYMSRATVNRKIRAITGESTNRFIQSYRLKRAAQLLKENFGNVTEVSFEVGFSSSAYFSKCFKEKFHQAPHDFQAAEAER